MTTPEPAERARPPRPATTLATVVAGAVIGAAIAVFAAGIAVGVLAGDAATPLLVPGWTVDEAAAALAAWGLPRGAAAAYAIGLELVTAAFGIGAGALLLHRPRSRFRLLVAVVLVVHTTLGGAAPALLAAALPDAERLGALSGLGWLALFAMALVFPDGRFEPRWTRWLLPAWVALLVVVALWPGPPPTAAAIAIVVLLVAGGAAQAHRYRRRSDEQTRLQTRWVLAVLGIRFLLVAIVAVVRTIEPESARTPPSFAFELAAMGASYLVSALLALAVAVAVLRHGLFGADVAVRRAFVYGALTAFVLLVYAALAGAAGLLWPGGGVVLPVLATAVAATCLLPLRAWLQRRVARLVLGARAEPLRLARDLGARLVSLERPEELVRAVVDAIGPALGLERAEIRLEPAGGAERVIAAHPLEGAAAVRPARDGAAGDASVFPIVHRGRRVGALEVRPRRDAPLSPADRRLLADVAAQAGLALAAARDAADLRAARDEAVRAREEERRRIQRDLHDGLGPTLASVYQRVELASRLVDADPGACRRLLEDTSRQVRDTVADVRRLVHALRPPRLADLGLVEALAAAADELSSGAGPRIRVRRPEALPELPASVETAAYRIALEAMTNVVRHAGARECAVELRVEGSGADRPDLGGEAPGVGASRLLVTVRDDGAGLPPGVVAGTGLRSLAERAEEVGGRVELAPAQPSGTIVTAVLPLPATVRGSR